jgi:hypothetical protein
LVGSPKDMVNPRRRHANDEAFLRRFVIPEEDRPRFTSAKWTETGGYRWFRSPNVVCLEHYRRSVRARK